MRPTVTPPSCQARREQCNVLIVSDLHLGAGRDPATRRISRREDFLCDEQARSFLLHYQALPGPWHLIINGDFLELLQVTPEDHARGALRRAASAYGPPCSEDEAVRKVECIAAGHPIFFEALAGWVSAGHLVTVVKGNHDVELHFPRVQEAVRQALRARAARAEAVDAGVRFSPWFYHEPGRLWVEHGNRFDGSNAFKHWLAPLLPDGPDGARRDDVDLPLGSMFVRYLFNTVEGVAPFADNIKPASAFLGWLFRRHPIVGLRFTFVHGRHMLSRVARAWAPVPEEAWRERARQHREARERLADAEGIGRAALAELDALGDRSLLREPRGWRQRAARALVRAYPAVLPLLGLLLLALTACVALGLGWLVYPGLPGAVRGAIAAFPAPWLGAAAPWALLVTAALAAAAALAWMTHGEQEPDAGELVDHARWIAEALGVRWVVMGHTHDADLRSLAAPGAPAAEYVNTGTWTPVFSERERLIRRDLECIFVEGVRGKAGELELRLLEWEDAAGQPRPLKLFGEERPRPDRSARREALHLREHRRPPPAEEGVEPPLRAHG